MFEWPCYRNGFSTEKVIFTAKKQHVLQHKRVNEMVCETDVNER